MFACPEWETVKVAGHLKAGDRVVDDAVDLVDGGGKVIPRGPRLGTVVEVCFRESDGLYGAMIDWDDGGAGLAIVADGKPRKAPVVL